MAISTMHRILIIGCPGARKSTLARKLAKVLDLPLFYLDLIYHREDHTTISKAEFDEKLNEILVQPRWIIDGNYQRTLPLRLSYADTVIFLDFDTKVCLDGINSRQGSKREDMPWESIVNDRQFVEFVQNFQSNNRPVILKLLQSLEETVDVLHFHFRYEMDHWLESLSNQ